MILRVLSSESYACSAFPAENFDAFDGKCSAGSGFDLGDRAAHADIAGGDIERCGMLVVMYFDDAIFSPTETES